MTTGDSTHVQFNSLQSFWPGLQVLVGDIEMAKQTHTAFLGVWKKYNVLPERYFFYSQMVHPTEKYYPLRPELIESTFFLYRATGDPEFLETGRYFYQSLMNVTKVEHGFCSVKNVETQELEDRMNSFFLAETCKYLYLLFDHENFLHKGNYLFSTEGHLFPIWEKQANIIRPEAEHTLMCMVPGYSKTANCHMEDTNPTTHTCRRDSECGLNEDCVKRKCSNFGFCFTPL